MVIRTDSAFRSASAFITYSLAHSGFQLHPKFNPLEIILAGIVLLVVLVKSERHRARSGPFCARAASWAAPSRTGAQVDLELLPDLNGDHVPRHGGEFRPNRIVIAR